MTNLGAALGWKYNHKAGIRTNNNKLTKWPASLGTKPTEDEQSIIMQEHEQYLTDNHALTKEGKIELIDNATSMIQLKEAIKKAFLND